MTGRQYWLHTLRPLVAGGYRRGWFDAEQVTLVNEEGAEVSIARPSANGHWERADLLLPAVSIEDIDPEIRRGITYLMKRPGNKDPLELSV